MAGIRPSQAVAVIERLCPWTTDPQGGVPNLDRHQAAQMAGVVAVTTAIPPELFAIAAEPFSDYLVALAAVRGALDAWHAGYQLFPLSGSHAVVIRDVLRRCPDAVPATTATQLGFIGNDAMRRALRMDISSIQRSLIDGEWKPATVLAGSVIEALLLWALEERDKVSPGDAARAAVAAKLRPRPVLDSWELHELVTVARTLNIISVDTATAAHLARNFRNLIHPGRALRLAEECTRGTAYSAVGAMERVIDDLTP
jgi:hypothetical protein